VEFEEKNVRSDYQALYELIDDLGGRQTPALVAGEQVIFGFDAERYEAALAAGAE
jgi:glutaredoxin